MWVEWSVRSNYSTKGLKEKIENLMEEIGLDDGVTALMQLGLIQKAHK